MEENLKLLLNTLQSLEIKSTESNLSKLLGCIQLIQQMQEELKHD